jgi:hypothetical protein
MNRPSNMTIVIDHPTLQNLGGGVSSESEALRLMTQNLAISQLGVNENRKKLMFLGSPQVQLTKDSYRYIRQPY